ncbi:MAG: glycosyltransferase [Methanobrevibacter sp.]|jgi:glycosyltransferase involved in cell wall biosynthesis|nr:glycosyltransferase [Candidatus Methanovirga aequatorialis]
MVKVSILIPTFNRAEILKRAIISAFNQDHENLEVIVSDNASNDNTQEIVSEFLEDNRFKYYKNEENIGLVNNCKKLVFDYMTGEYFIILGDDDYLIKNDYISKVINLFENNNNVLIVFSYWYLYFKDIDKKNEIKYDFNEIEDGKTVFMDYLKFRNPSMSNTVFNREFALKTDAFNNENNNAFDLILILKACLCGDVGLIREFSSVDTSHSGSLSRNLSKNYDYIINSVNHVVEPYNLAIRYNKLSDDEKYDWENRVILRVFLSTVSSVLFFFPERFQNTLIFLERKNNGVFQSLVNDNVYYKLIVFLNKIHLFRSFYKILYYFYMLYDFYMLYKF